jgi:hypothetical protein
MQQTVVELVFDALSYITCHFIKYINRANVSLKKTRFTNGGEVEWQQKKS